MTADQTAAPTDPPLTTGQVARRYNVNRATVTRWADQGLLPFFTTPSGQRRFHAADIDARTEAPTPSKSA